MLLPQASDSPHPSGSDTKGNNLCEQWEQRLGHLPHDRLEEKSKLHISEGLVEEVTLWVLEVWENTERGRWRTYWSLLPQYLSGFPQGKAQIHLRGLYHSELLASEESMASLPKTEGDLTGLGNEAWSGMASSTAGPSCLDRIPRDFSLCLGAPLSHFIHGVFLPHRA